MSAATAGFGFGRRQLKKSRVPETRIILPQEWRDLLPTPHDYYQSRLVVLSSTNAAGWARTRCPFHSDREASFSVNFGSASGRWHCFAGCGSGDLVAFHMKQYGMSFVPAVRELIGLRK